jgi:rhodanese-related sulfurtransferase
VARQLRKVGYNNVKIMKGGLAAWASAGLPLESKPA